MASLKKHFPHFASLHHNSNHSHHQQNLQTDKRPGPESSQASKSLPASLRNAANVTACCYDAADATTCDLTAQMDTLSFKADVLSCLDLCSSYVQALNNLCSAGAVLAQNLTQVFSRDVAPAGQSSCSSYSSCKTGSRRRLLGAKTGHSRSQVTPGLVSPLDPADSLYYDMTEQFLHVWEMLSVSTAGASATIKTETLMTLQEVINRLESADSGSSQHNDVPSSEEMGANLPLGQSIESAKSCLLAYIELQAQFSHSSWKSLSHLSKALKADANMTNVVQNIKQHFDFNPNNNNKSVGAEKCGDVFSSHCNSMGDNPPDSKKKQSSEVTGVNTVSGLKEAMDLLSLGDGVQKVKMRRSTKRASRKEFRAKDERKTRARESSRGKENVVANTRRCSQLGDKCFSSSQVEGVECNNSNRTEYADVALKSHSTSTWPGKAVVNTANPCERHDSVNLKVSCDSWSPWSSNSPSFASHTNSMSSSAVGSPVWRSPQTTSGWQVFPNQSSHSLSSSQLQAVQMMSASTISGSRASSNMSIDPLSTSSSLATNRSYDLFAPVHKSSLSFANGTRSLKETHFPGIINSINNNNNNIDELSFHNFGELTDNLNRNCTSVMYGNRFGAGDAGFNSRSGLLDTDTQNQRKTSLISNFESLLVPPANMPVPLIPDSVKSKTSTWPMKQDSLMPNGPLLNFSASSSTQRRHPNSNLVTLCSSPLSLLPEDYTCDNSSDHRPLAMDNTCWTQDEKHNNSRQVHNVSKSDSLGLPAFESNNNCTLSDKNFVE